MPPLLNLEKYFFLRNSPIKLCVIAFQEGLKLFSRQRFVFLLMRSLILRWCFHYFVYPKYIVLLLKTCSAPPKLSCHKIVFKHIMYFFMWCIIFSLMLSYCIGHNALYMNRLALGFSWGPFQEEAVNMWDVRDVIISLNAVYCHLRSLKLMSYMVVRFTFFSYIWFRFSYQSCSLEPANSPN